MVEEQKVQIEKADDAQGIEPPQRVVRKYNTGFGKKKGNAE